MPKTFKTSTSLMGEVAIDKGGCKVISLLRETQREWHFAGSKLIFHSWPQIDPGQHQQ